jgi:uncharacterized protein (DUF2236 family)
MEAADDAQDLIIRVLYRESLLFLLAWPRAILMQLAHPLVAAGVAQHSDFRRRPWSRLIHTIDAALMIAFGSDEQVDKAIRRIDGVHSRVHGSLEPGVGSFPSGTPYDAHYPELLRWVYATTIDSELRAYDRYLGGLQPGWEQRYYEQTRPNAVALGVPQADLPETFAELRGWLETVVESGMLAIGAQQRELALAVLYPPVPLVPRPLFEPLVAVSLGLLPERVRAGYGLELGGARRRLFDWSPGMVRMFLAILPDPVRYLPLLRARHLGIAVDLA